MTYGSRIPREFESALRFLGATDLNTEFSRVEKVIAGESSSLSLDSIRQELSQVVAEEDANSLVELLLACHLQVEQNFQEREQVVRSFASMLRVFDKTASTEQFSLVDKRLSLLLSKDGPIRLQAKAVELMTAQERLMREVRIFSDIRPVFTSNESVSKPSAAIVAHTLRVAYYQDGELKTFYVSMDYGDLMQLDNQVQRAKDKASELDKLLKAADVSRIDTE